MAVTRTTRNRFVGVEPARGFESHLLRMEFGEMAGVVRAVSPIFYFLQVRAEVGRCTDLAVPQPRLNLLPRSRSRTAPRYENCTFGKLSGTEAKIQAKPPKITIITVTNSMMRRCYGSIENQRCLFIIPHPPARRMHAEATYDCFSFEPPKGGSFFALKK